MTNGDCARGPGVAPCVVEPKFEAMLIHSASD